MKVRDFTLLADENMLHGVVSFLRGAGFDVKFVREEKGLVGKKDIELMSIAFQESRVIITQDGDFGQIVFTQNVDFLGIIYLRPGHFPADRHIDTLKTVLELDPNLEVPFLLMADNRNTSIRMKVRNAHPGPSM